MIAHQHIIYLGELPIVDFLGGALNAKNSFPCSYKLLTHTFYALLASILCICK